MIEDIRIIIQGSKAKLGGLTERGLAWLYYNMWTPAWSQGITIDKENVDEIKQLIEKDGLIVKEK